MGSVELSKEELVYRSRMDNVKSAVHSASSSSPMEGFEYFASSDYKRKLEDLAPDDDNTRKSFKNSVYKPMVILSKHLLKIEKGQRESFKVLEPYLKEIERNGRLMPATQSLLQTYPNESTWQTLCEFAWAQYGLKLGFTEVPEGLIFKKKSILFKYAIVCIQEMDEAMMKEAPSLNASDEVIRIYKELGLAVNDFADYLRNSYGIRCQSNHPLGGLTNTSPLAAKAGMGWQGHNGLLITPWYGQRQRIATIFIEEPIFEYTDHLEHTWIEEFCKKCRKCEKNCPANAILPEKKIVQVGIPVIENVRTCINKEKCYEYFNKSFGCGRCVSVCPFSQGKEKYLVIKRSSDKLL